MIESAYRDAFLETGLKRYDRRRALIIDVRTAQAPAQRSIPPP
jgi:hypothetical protein